MVEWICKHPSREVIEKDTEYAQIAPLIPIQGRAVK